MSKKVQKKIISIGIDVSKDKNNICFMFQDTNLVEEFEIKNNLEGFKTLRKRISKYEIGESPIVIESTGSYHLPVCFYLFNNGYKVKLINPIITKKYTNANIRKCKTDRTDAILLAKIGVIEELKDFKPNKEDIILKRKSKMLEKLLKNRQSLKLAFKSYKEDFTKNEMGLGNFVKTMEKTLKELEKTIKILEKEIVDLGKKFNDFEKISEIKGVGEKSASIVVGFIGDKEFKNKKSLVAFAGLDVSVKQSGSSIFGRGKISKRGSSLFRKTLTGIAWGLTMHNEYFKNIALKYKKLGRHYYEILVIIARKFLHIIYGMIKNNSNFCPV